MIQFNHSNTLSHKEITRISKRVLIFIIIHQIALMKSDCMQTNLNASRNLFLTIKPALEIFEKPEIQFHCFMMFKESVDSEDFDSEVTFQEFERFWTFPKYSNLNFILYTIKKIVHENLFDTPEKLTKYLISSITTVNTIRNHMGLFATAFPIFCVNMKLKKIVDNTEINARFVQILFETFSNHQPGWILMRKDVDKYLKQIEAMSSNSEVLAFHFENYSSTKGIMEAWGAKRFLTDVIEIRCLLHDNIVDPDVFAFDETQVLEIAKTCVNAKEIKLEEFKQLVKSEKFVPFVVSSLSKQ